MDNVLNAAIELHDSELAGIEHVSGALVLEFRPAYIHKSKGRPGFDAGIGVVQDLVIRIEGALIEGDFGEIPACVLDGELQIGTETAQCLIALPCNIVDSVRLSLHLSPDYRKVSVSGRRIEVLLNGEATYVEDVGL